MRVCVVTETFPPEVNGVAHTLGHLVLGLRALGHTVTVVHPRRPGRDAEDRATTLVAGVGFPGYPGVRLGLPAGALLRARWTAQRPDVVYVATPGPLGWSAVRAARGLGVRAVSGFHTNFDRYARHYHGRWLTAPLRRGLRFFHNATALTLVPTPELRDGLRAAGFRRLGVLGRGVDTRLFDPARRSAALRARWGATGRDPVALYVGRVAPEKNIGLAVEAYRVMRAAGTVRTFVVVGDGPARAALQRAHPDLLFAGVQSGEALAAHYASADLFLFPSETETFGNVVLEAMASGLAVVAYDDAAARGHITHGATGVLAACGDRAAFVAGAAALAAAPAMLRTIRRHARDAAIAVDWPSVVERFAGLLSGAAERAGADEPVEVGA